MVSTGSNKARTIPSNRLSHGLTSRAVAEARASEIIALARALVGDEPLIGDVKFVAEALADSILSLHAVRRARHALLANRPVATPSDALDLFDQIERLAVGKLSNAEILQAIDKEEVGESADLRCLLQTMTTNARELRRLEEYERKAHSRYRKRLMRLDHAMIEARRRR